MSAGEPSDIQGDSPTPQAPAYLIVLDKSNVLRISAYGVLLLVLAAGVFAGMFGSSGASTTGVSWPAPLLYLVVFAGTLILHESVHGLFFRLFGGRPRYGAGVTHGLPYLFATAPGQAFPLRRMIIIALAPLVTLSAVSLLVALAVPAWTGYCAVVFITNTSGAIGDIWITSRLARFLRLDDVTVVDQRNGSAVFTPDARVGAVVARLTMRDARRAGLVVYWAGAFTVLLLLQAAVGVVAPLFTTSLTIGPPQMPLVAFHSSEQGMELTIGLVAPLAFGLMFALAVRLLWGRRASGRTKRSR